MADYNLEALSLCELKKMQKDVGKVTSTYQDRQKAEARAKVEALARDLGYSLAELVSTETKSSIAPAAARYRHPESSALTWSGRGRKPQLCVEATMISLRSARTAALAKLLRLATHGMDQQRHLAQGCIHRIAEGRVTQPVQDIDQIVLRLLGLAVPFRVGRVDALPDFLKIPFRADIGGRNRQERGEASRDRALARKLLLAVKRERGGTSDPIKASGEQNTGGLRAALSLTRPEPPRSGLPLPLGIADVWEARTASWPTMAGTASGIFARMG
jgi:DNA-binding protein H-NS